MAKRRKELDTLTATEAIEEHWVIANYLQWDKRVIGVFCQSGLVIGKYDKTLKEWVVQRESFMGLIRYVRTTLPDVKGG